MLPCHPDGAPLEDSEDLFVEEPSELVSQQRLVALCLALFLHPTPLALSPLFHLLKLGSSVNFLLKIPYAHGIPHKYTKVEECTHIGQ